MKHIILPVLVIVVLICSFGCSEKFNIAAPYKNITVVYAFLDANDTAHYVRIQKAFLDQNKSALTMAQQYDSNYYNNLYVRIKRISFTGEVHDTIQLKLVDLDAEGYPKQPGVFFNVPNQAYKFTGPLDDRYIYRIMITDLNPGGKTDSAESPVIDDSRFSTFYVDELDSSQHPLMDFSSTASYKTFNIAGNYLAPTGFSYWFNGVNYNIPVATAQVIIRFNWVDSEITAGGTQTHHYVDYDAGFMPMPYPSVEFDIKDIQLYNALASGMGKAPTNVARLLDRCDLTMYMSTPDFVTYQQRAQTQGTGLTGGEIEPAYTNVKGDNSLGLFTARGSRTGKITLTDATVDSLKISSLFSGSNIKGTVYH